MTAGSSKGNPGKKSYKAEKGYSKVGGLLKSKATKGEIESKQKRLNAFSAAENKQVGDAINRNAQTKQMINQGMKMNEYGLPAGDQKYKKKKVKFANPKFRKS